MSSSVAWPFTACPFERLYSAGSNPRVVQYFRLDLGGDKHPISKERYCNDREGKGPDKYKPAINACRRGEVGPILGLGCHRVEGLLLAVRNGSLKGGLWRSALGLGARTNRGTRPTP